MSEGLPENWDECQLVDLVEILDSQRIPINNMERTERLASSANRFPYYGATGQVGEIDDYIFEGEAVLLGEDAAPFLDPYKSKAYMASGKYWVNNHAHILRGTGAIDNTFLCHQLNVLNYRGFVSGTTRLKLTQASMKELPLRIPPLPEQQRIVEKIETLFARLDKGEEAVREVQKLLTRYRQSVLKSAVTGQFTADWRVDHPTNENGQDHLNAISASRREKTTGRFKAPASDQRAGMPDIPDSWCWASLDALIWDGPTNGVSPKASEDRDGVKSFKLTATTSGYFIIDDNTIKRVNIELEADSKYWLKEGDVLIQRGNTIEYVGTAAVFPGPDKEYIYPDLMMRLRFTDDLVARWATLWINFEFAKRYFRANATGTAGNMPKINGTTLKGLSVPIPPREEMLACVELVEEEFAKARPAEEFCKTELKRSASLRQSILKDAFAGRLVHQDPTDEPASALLARIAEAKTPTKKTRRKVQA